MHRTQPPPIRGRLLPRANPLYRGLLSTRNSSPAETVSEATLSRRTFPGWRTAVALLVGSLVFLSFVTFPTVTPHAEDGAGCEADTSLSMILEHAHQQGLQFGTQHAYTYGPLGFLTFPQYQPRYAALHLVADVLLGIIVASGLCLLAWRLHPGWRFLLLGAFVWIAANTLPRTELVVDTGLLCFGLLCLVETGRRLRQCAVGFALLAAFAALAKNSFLFVASFSVGLVALDLLTRGERRLGLGTLAGFVASFLAGWILLGQNLANLPGFVANALGMVGGYNSALGWAESLAAGWVVKPLALLLFTLIGLTSLTAFDRPEQRLRWRRLWLFCWLGVLGFAAWKHGVVRAYTCNLQMLFGFMAVVGVALQVLPVGAAARRWVRGLGLAGCLLPLAAAQWLFFPPLSSSLAAPLRAVCQNAATLLNPTAFLDRMDGIVAGNRRAGQLPEIRKLAGRATIDVFGRRQGFALYNDLNFHPRPLPQSYAVANAHFMRLNQQFYLSPDAPEFVLFELNALDRKLAVLEDAWVLRHLLINYQQVGAEAGFLLLEKRASTAPRLTLLREETVRAGKRIDAQGLGSAPLWIEIEMTPSWAGRLREICLRPPAVRLSVWGDSGQELLARGRAPASMLAAGFLASPFLEQTGDVRALYAGEPVPRPAGYQVELPPGDRKYWRDEIRVRLYRVENAIPGFAGRAAAAVADADKNPRPASLFRATRWRPDQPSPGNVQEQLALALMVLLPLALTGMLVVFARRLRRRTAPTGWRDLVLGNSLVLLLFLSIALLCGELYFRFIYDTTDSLGYVRVSERWVQRHWQVNAAGCRDNVEYQTALTPGRPRITFIGDSFTAGHGIRNVNDRFANRLRQAHADWEIQVLANVGLDTGSETALVQRAARQGYGFGEVVLVYCLNDIGDLLPQGGLNTAQVAAGWANDRWLLRNSYLLNLLYHRYQASRNAELRNYFPLVREGYTGPAWEQQKARLKALRDLVHSNGGHLSVVTFPFLHDLAPGQDYEQQYVHDQLNQFWQELRVPHLDLAPVFAGHSSKELIVNRYDAHPNEYASDLAARAIDQFLSPLVRPRAQAPPAGP